VLFTACKSHRLDAGNYQFIAPMASVKVTVLFRKI